MNEKVLLILVDGMRPDGIEQCAHPYLRELRQKCTSSMDASTVMPSVTLPCHASLFLSVDAERHGITTNTWVPQVRPIDSIGDAAARARKKCAMFYNWEELRDLCRPGSLDASFYCAVDDRNGEADRKVTAAAIDYIREDNPDFVFLYLGYTDIAGHTHGWMTPDYLDAISTASACIESVCAVLPEGWSVIITADHGGHERTHGTNLPCDMTIPLYFYGAQFPAGQVLQGKTIKDIAPTIAKLMDFPIPSEWEGQSVL